ncbi:mitochondrial ribosomal death-associated protein 3-domain-containing protein [Apodospora peruviana]|uniref:Small ribosomal subunit protein mS29 n=1 Tax=Apodospora peruviana TaxID=516989 RepID=A0AAE0IRD2_9PEZI|nr:mitochondrial ribosomal death-associated protein 3-domain-containing protein [Apodospora peruviana]
MSAPNCLRCLTRPSTAVLRHSIAVPNAVASWTASAPFSTTATAAAGPTKGARPTSQPKRMETGHIRSGRRVTISKSKHRKQAGARGKTPLPGERKAYRKKIQLSNSNALHVHWLSDLDAKHMLDAANVTKVMGLPDALVDQLRAVEAFKPKQTWGFFRKPSTLIRPETVDLVTRMQQAATDKQTLKLVLDGDKLTGKSILMLQAMSHAFFNEWIVIHIPEAQELTTAVTEYAPIPGTDPVQYMQQNYALKLIQNIRKANEKVLVRMATAYSHPEIPQQMPIGSSLMQLANSAKEPENAWTIFMALWKELTANTRGRVPILFALDGLSHIMKVSDYRSPAFELIHSHDLALVRLFTDCLGGNISLPYGGAILAATTRNNVQRSLSMELAIAQREAEQLGAEKPLRQAYIRGYDHRVEAAMRAAQVIKVKGINKLEARSLMEYWAASGVLRTTVDELSVSEKWMLSGNGVLGEMERASLLTMRI